MAITYDSIATVTLGSAAQTMTFSSIPNTYTDLKLVFLAKAIDSSNRYFMMQFNGDETAQYSQEDLYATGASAAANIYTTSSGFSGNLFNIVSAQSSFNNYMTADIFSYTSSQWKTYFMSCAQDGSGTVGVVVSAGMYQSTSAISSITLRMTAAVNIPAGATASLYGILKA